MSTESIEAEVEQIRKHFLKYTRQAFQSLPKMTAPFILDVGCGSGIPTIELAKLSGGKIVGIDMDQNELEKLDKKIQEKGLTNRVSTKNCSLTDICFPDETFDILWAEGSLHIVGFEKGLKKLNPLLKPRGFLVIHDGLNDVSANLGKFAELGYNLVNQFNLPDDEWQLYYFGPLEHRIKEWKKNPKNSQTIKKYQNQVNFFRKNPKENMSGFYVFQKPCT
jgi:ubiquinone/menaquinone biosynthesis C-methylase UbiE